MAYVLRLARNIAGWCVSMKLPATEPLNGRLSARLVHGSSTSMYLGVKFRKWKI
jgi:hypothetical protein